MKIWGGWGIVERESYFFIGLGKFSQKKGLLRDFLEEVWMDVGRWVGEVGRVR